MAPFLLLASFCLTGQRQHPVSQSFFNSLKRQERGQKTPLKIFTIKYNNNRTFDWSARSDNSLSAKTKGMMLTLLSFGNCMTNQSEFERLFSDGRSALTSGWGELQQKQYAHKMSIYCVNNTVVTEKAQKHRKLHSKVRLVFSRPITEMEVSALINNPAQNTEQQAWIGIDGVFLFLWNIYFSMDKGEESEKDQKTAMLKIKHSILDPMLIFKDSITSINIILKNNNNKIILRSKIHTVFENQHHQQKVKPSKKKRQRSPTDFTLKVITKWNSAPTTSSIRLPKNTSQPYSKTVHRINAFICQLIDGTFWDCNVLSSTPDSLPSPIQEKDILSAIDNLITRTKNGSAIKIRQTDKNLLEMFYNPTRKFSRFIHVMQHPTKSLQQAIQDNYTPKHSKLKSIAQKIIKFNGESAQQIDALLNGFIKFQKAVKQKNSNTAFLYFRTPAQTLTEYMDWIDEQNWVKKPCAPTLLNVNGKMFLRYLDEFQKDIGQKVI